MGLPCAPKQERRRGARLRGPCTPSQKEDEEDLAAFELPFLQRLVVQLWAMVLGLITRLTERCCWWGVPR
jgi:hypothetical protein